MSDEIERLAAYFRDEEPDAGRDGDWRDDSTVTTALRLLRERRGYEAAVALLREWEAWWSDVDRPAPDLLPKTRAFLSEQESQ